MSLEKTIRHVLSEPTPSTPVGTAEAGDLPAGLQRIRPQRLIPAAVLVPLVARDEFTVLLTRRQADLKHHGGQVSFPGGRIEASDEGPVAAALRETEEEIGVAHDRVEVLGALETYRTLTGYTVTPVVGLLEPGFEIVPDAREVAAVFEVPLAYLMDPANRIRQKRSFFGYEVSYYEIDWEEHRIWGATAAMLIRFLTQLEQANA